MPAIDHLTLQVADVGTADTFYAALDLADRVRTRASDEPVSGFRGFTLSLVVAQPADVLGLVDTATAAGGSLLKPPAKSLWGYGGVVRSPDGTIVTLASSSKKDTEPATGQIDDVVLQLGVSDVAASKRFYLDHGLDLARSYGRKYVEFASGALTLTLLKDTALARTVGVARSGSEHHGLLIHGEVGSFTDPDGFRWETSAT